MDTKNKLLSLNGLIIKEEKYKEYDKLLTILTKELGKKKVYAFGVRKQSSKNIGKSRLFTFLRFDLREVNDRCQLESCEIIKSFDELSNDYETLCHASYFLELADYFSLENVEANDICNLLFYTFKTLNDKKIPYELIRRIFELKILQYEGIYRESKSVPSKLRYTWDFIINNKNAKLYSFTLTDELLKLLSSEVSVEMREKVGKKFKSLN